MSDSEEENSEMELPEWAQIQRKTFTRWCNQQLKPVHLEITDLQVGLKDGVNLVNLVELLTKQPSPNRITKKPRIKMQMMENIGIGLKILADDGIKLVNIGTTDIYEGNMKLILGLIWTLILRYQISMDFQDDDDDKKGNEGSAKKQLQEWATGLINNLPEGVKVNNFTTDWNDGVALCSMVEAVAPGLCPEYKCLDPSAKLENARLGLDRAEQGLGVEKIIEAEDLINPNIDELSVLTYVSLLKNATPTIELVPSDPQKIRIYGPGTEEASLNKPAQFFIDTSDAGFGKLDVEIKNCHGEPVPVERIDKDNETEIQYTPEISGDHKFNVTYNRNSVPNGSFTVTVEENPPVAKPELAPQVEIEPPQVDIEDIPEEETEPPQVDVEDMPEEETGPPEVDVEDMPEEETEPPQVAAEDMPEEETEPPEVDVEDMPKEETESPQVAAEDMPEEETEPPQVAAEDMPEEETEPPQVAAEDIPEEETEPPQVDVEDVPEQESEPPQVDVEDVPEQESEPPEVSEGKNEEAECEKSSESDQGSLSDIDDQESALQPEEEPAESTPKRKAVSHVISAAVLLLSLALLSSAGAENLPSKTEAALSSLFLVYLATYAAVDQEVLSVDNLTDWLNTTFNLVVCPGLVTYLAGTISMCTGVCDLGLVVPTLGALLGVELWVLVEHIQPKTIAQGVGVTVGASSVVYICL